MIAVYNRDIWFSNYVNLSCNNSFFFKNLKFEYREILEDTATQIANSYQEKHLHERIITSDVLLFFSTTVLLRFFACSHWSSCSALGGYLFFLSFRQYEERWAKIGSEKERRIVRRWTRKRVSRAYRLSFISTRVYSMAAPLVGTLLYISGLSRRSRQQVAV